MFLVTNVHRLPNFFVSSLPKSQNKNFYEKDIKSYAYINLARESGLFDEYMIGR